MSCGKRRGGSRRLRVGYEVAAVADHVLKSSAGSLLNASSQGETSRRSSLRTLEIRTLVEIGPDPDYVFADNVGAKYNADVRTFDPPA
jgi:hypothetical protein